MSTPIQRIFPHVAEKTQYCVIFQYDDGLYQAIVKREGTPLYASVKSVSARNVALWANKAIERLNTEYAIRPKLPPLNFARIDAFVYEVLQSKNAQPDTESAVRNAQIFAQKQADVQRHKKASSPMPKTQTKTQIKTKTKNQTDTPMEMKTQTQTQTQTQTVNIKTQRKKVIPRKPFTPYGLQGYLVDKQGNIRLNLDRKANAQTIVLTADMFNVLAEMVRKTQAQARN